MEIDNMQQQLADGGQGNKFDCAKGDSGGSKR